MDCPVCHKPLVVVERSGIELDWCLRCRGLWFDAGELELLAEATGRRLSLTELTAGPRATPDRSQRACPRCGAKMEVHRLALASSVSVDLCPTGHGVWLDPGELDAVLGGLPRTPEGPASEVAAFLLDVFPPGDAPGPPGPSPPQRGP